MKYLLILPTILVGLLLIQLTQASITNTTDFYNSETKTKLGYESYAGYQNVFDNGSAAIYYSLWQGYNLPWSDHTVPLIIWLQGGPGGPSQFGCFNQVGPLFIEGPKGSQKPVENPWSWNFYGHLLCIDQPIGVGFSYNNATPVVNNSRTAAEHLSIFLKNFFTNNPSLGLKQNPLYISGQSYAGHYIPAIAQLLAVNTQLGINIKGVMIGDGWVDPIYQSGFYDSYLNSVGVVSNHWRDTTAFMQNQAIIRIQRGDLQHAAGYINFIIADDNVTAKDYLGMNVLNYKQYDAGQINPEYSAYLQLNKKSFGVPDWLNYVDNNEQMYYAFNADLSASYKRELQKLLNLNLRVMIYNGQNDFIVNTPGVLSYLNTLEWTYAKQWRNANKKMWTQFGSENLGWSKSYRNLMFVLVRDAGHLLPSDQGRSAWWMLNRYFLNSW